MSYLEQVLQPEEQIKHLSRPHWIAYSDALLIGVPGAVFTILGAVWNPGALVLGAMFLVLAVLAFIPAWIQRVTTEIVVTDRRIIYKEGLISRSTIEMNMDKVESVDVEQSVLGRILNYGTILIRGTGEGLEPLRRIAAPIELRNSIMVPLRKIN